ncbi:MAG: hypothetical protein ACREBY_07255 [Polaromonas sp.]
MFEETLATDQASLDAQLEALRCQPGAQGEPATQELRRRPKRQALPEHLQRVEHHHEPEHTTSPNFGQSTWRWPFTGAGLRFFWFYFVAM